MRAGQGQEGFALVLILWVLLLLSMIGSAYALAVRAEALAARNAAEDLEAYALALAGFQQALAEILGEWDVNYLDSSGSVAFARKDGARVESPRRGGRLVTGEMGYRITDEEGKVNVNRASRALLTSLLKNLELAVGANIDEVVDSILDWIDPDALRRLNGAEDDYYLGLRIPYAPKNGPMSVPEELLLVKGITPDLYAVLSEALTVYGTGGVNVNTAPPAVLRAVFPNDAPRLIGQRGRPLLEAPAPGIVSSSTFSVLAWGRAATGRVPRVVKVVLSRLPEATDGEAKKRYVIRSWSDDAVPGIGWPGTHR